MRKALTAEPATAGQVALVVRKYAPALAPDYDGRWPYPADSTPDRELIPAADLPALIDALEISLQPASEREVAETLALIAAAWPYAHQRTDEGTLDLHMHQLAEDLAEFPVDALRGAVRNVRRTTRFMPSIAELYQAAYELVADRKRQLYLAQEHQRERARRAAEAERKAKEEAARQEERRREQRARLNRLVAAHGKAWEKYTVDDLDTASNALFKLGYRHTGFWWMDALDCADQIVCAMLPFALIAGRVLELREQRRLEDWDACKIIQLAYRDPEGAAALVAHAAGAAGRVAGAQSPRTGDDGVAHSDPVRLFSELVDALRHDRLATVGGEA